MLRLLAASGLPTVLLDEDSNVPRIHSVRDDCFEGARQAILYLAKLGHRRIAYAHWDRSDMNRWRLSGFRKGLKDAGLTYRAHREILTEMTIAGAARWLIGCSFSLRVPAHCTASTIRWLVSRSRNCVVVACAFLRT